MTERPRYDDDTAVIRQEEELTVATQAQEAGRLGLPAPNHARIAALIAEAERGQLRLVSGNIARIGGETGTSTT